MSRGRPTRVYKQAMCIDCLVTVFRHLKLLRHTKNEITEWRIEMLHKFLIPVTDANTLKA